MFEGCGRRNEIPIIDLGCISAKIHLFKVCSSPRTHLVPQKRRKDSGVFIFEIKPSGVEKEEEKGERKNLSEDLKVLDLTQMLL